MGINSFWAFSLTSQSLHWVLIALIAPPRQCVPSSFWWYSLLILMLCDWGVVNISTVSSFEVPPQSGLLILHAHVYIINILISFTLTGSNSLLFADTLDTLHRTGYLKFEKWDFKKITTSFLVLNLLGSDWRWISSLGMLNIIE